jgi:hypothetical protein
MSFTSSVLKLVLTNIIESLLADITFSFLQATIHRHRHRHQMMLDR